MPCATWSLAITVWCILSSVRAAAAIPTYGTSTRWDDAWTSTLGEGSPQMDDGEAIALSRLRAYEPCHCSHRRFAASIRTHRLITTRNCALSTASRSRARSTGFDSAMGDHV